MRTRLAFVMLLLVVACSGRLAGAQTAWTVETERGEKVQITNVAPVYLKFSSRGTYVEVGKDSAGNPLRRYSGSKFQTEITTQVPLRAGDAFGFRFRLPHIDPGDAVVIDLKTELPVPVRGHRVVDWSLRFDSKLSEKTRLVHWTFRPENPHYHVPGTWVHKVYNKGQLLTSQTFTVTRP